MIVAMRQGRKAVAVASTVLVAVLGTSAPANSATDNSHTGFIRPDRTTAVFALPPQTIPDYIFPLMDPAHFTVDNGAQFQQLMYRPLYYFGGDQNADIDQQLSLAYPPMFSADGTTVTVKLKHYAWSDGEEVTARDVQFWQNLVTANKDQWGAYVPGSYPDDVLSTTIVDNHTIVFHLDKAYAQKWFWYNELSQVTPLPMAWDKTSAHGRTGTADLTPAGAQAVYQFLSSQSSDRASFAHSPIWSVVDGPWRLDSITPLGEVVFVPNPRYAGPVKPTLRRFVERPFDDNAGEYAALTASPKQISVGYLPVEDASSDPSTQLSGLGYDYQPWSDFAISFIQLNQHNPTVGAIFRQTYVRQALEMLIDQDPNDPFGYPTCGPVPLKPPNPYVTSTEVSCPFAFDPAKSAATLAAHGWAVVPGGVTSCANPGTGAGECGDGIAAGQRLQFDLVYAEGDAAEDADLHALVQTASANDGIALTLHPETFNDTVGTAVHCESTEADCTWQIVDFGGWLYSPDYYPSGEQLFATDSLANTTNYANPQMDALIQATQQPGDGTQALSAYADFVTEEVPVIWHATDYYYLAEVDSNLSGFTPTAFLGLLPEQWRIGCGGT